MRSKIWHNPGTQSIRSAFRLKTLYMNVLEKDDGVGWGCVEFGHHPCNDGITHTHTNDEGRANFRHQFQFRLSLLSGKWSSIYCTMPFDLVRPRTITERWQPARERDVTQLQHCNVYLPFHSKSHAFIAENGLSTSTWQGWGHKEHSNKRKSTILLHWRRAY